MDSPVYAPLWCPWGSRMSSTRRTFHRHGSDIYPVSAGCGCRLRALIREAGGIVLGKTVTAEFAFVNPNKTRNPHNLAHTPGGSSSGSAAAVADFMVPMTFGTDGWLSDPTGVVLRCRRLETDHRSVQLRWRKIARALARHAWRVLTSGARSCPLAGGPSWGAIKRRPQNVATADCALPHALVGTCRPGEPDVCSRCGRSIGGRGR